MRTCAIYGCGGTVLSRAEQSFFSDARPWGFILFARNVDSLRKTVDDPMAPVLIDQEGGRVARLKPPHWRERLPAARFGALHAANPGAAREAVYINARLIAHELHEIGINVNCAPVLDVPVEGADDIIGDRAFSRDPSVVGFLGRAMIDGMIDGGVLPVMKHIPGHGRAGVDSHLALPRVEVSHQDLSKSDFVSFRLLSDCPLAMTAHVVYAAIDPSQPATTSARIVRDVIRGELAFGGLLLTDDLSMQALSGTFAERARAAQAAGCDIVLHCNGKMDEMREVATEVMRLQSVSLRRANTALEKISARSDFDCTAGEARLAELLRLAA
jgi:beta-N-acetylhexosaminidase